MALQFKCYGDGPTMSFIMEVVDKDTGERAPGYGRVVLDLSALVTEDGQVHDVEFRLACVKVDGVQKVTLAPMAVPFTPGEGTTASEGSTDDESSTTDGEPA